MFALRTLRKRKWILLLPPLFVCVSLTCFPTFSQTHSASVVDLDGRPADPFRLAGSKIVVLLFVRTDCPISNRYAPTIQDLSAHYATNAAFFLVYPIKSETPDQIRHYLIDYGYHLLALRDPDLTLARFSQVTITPEVAVFSPAKKLLYHGRIDDWYVEFTRARRAPTTHDLSPIPWTPQSLVSLPPLLLPPPSVVSFPASHEVLPLRLVFLTAYRRTLVISGTTRCGPSLRVASVCVPTCVRHFQP